MRSSSLQSLYCRLQSGWLWLVRRRSFMSVGCSVVTLIICLIQMTHVLTCKIHHTEMKRKFFFWFKHLLVHLHISKEFLSFSNRICYDKPLISINFFTPYIWNSNGFEALKQCIFQYNFNSALMHFMNT